MKCPECGNECKKGFVEIRDAGSLLQSLTTATWFPEENKGKKIRKNLLQFNSCDSMSAGL